MKEFMQQWGSLIAFLGLIGIEISPIKINPIKWFGKVIGKLLNGELIDKVNENTNKVMELSTKVNKLEKDSDFKDLRDIKTSLSTFHVMMATTGLDENQYRRCFELEQKYQEYKNKYPGEVNGHMDALLEAIHHNYKKGNILKVDLQNK